MQWGNEIQEDHSKVAGTLREMYGSHERINKLGKFRVHNYECNFRSNCFAELGMCTGNNVFQADETWGLMF